MLVLSCWCQYLYQKLVLHLTLNVTCRAYKLGKRRWSFNQCELLLMLADSNSPSKQPLPLTVTQATLIKGNESEATCNVSICSWLCFQTFAVGQRFLGLCLTHQLLDLSAIVYLLTTMQLPLCQYTHSCGLCAPGLCALAQSPCSIQFAVQDSNSSKISYQVQLSNGSHVIASFYLVYPEPSSSVAQQGFGCGTVIPTTEYSWSLVTRGVMLMLLGRCCLVYRACLLHVLVIQLQYKNM